MHTRRGCAVEFRPAVTVEPMRSRDLPSSSPGRSARYGPDVLQQPRRRREVPQLPAEAGQDVRNKDLVSVEPAGVELAADWNTLGSPETYVGYARATGLASPGGVDPDRGRLYVEPPRLELNQWALSGDWTVAEQVTTLNQPGGRITFRFRGRDLLGESERQLQAIRGRSVASTTPNARQYLNPVVPVGNQIANAILAHQKVGRSEAISRRASMARSRALE